MIWCGAPGAYVFAEATPNRSMRAFRGMSTRYQINPDRYTVNPRNVPYSHDDRHVAFVHNNREIATG
jgi:hypothetical protein